MPFTNELGVIALWIIAICVLLAVASDEITF
jgi:hypothetical protein